MSCMNTMWIWKAGIPPEAVFKTLVARGAGGHTVGVVPVAAQLKKADPTVFDASAQALGSICVSAGRPGLQVQAAPAALAGLCGASFAAITQGTAAGHAL